MNKKLAATLTFLLVLIALPALAETPLFKHSTDKAVAQFESTLIKNLENERLFVIFEANISKNLSHFKERWGENFNRNELKTIKSLLICNPWYANQVSNEDPDMLAFCPLRVNLTESDNQSNVLFIQPSKIFPNSPAAKTLKELESSIIEAIEASTR